MFRQLSNPSSVHYQPPASPSSLSPQVRDESEFVDRLGCGDTAGVKVLSIFGNTGDGKSHTLNHILFGGESVFYTSKSPSSCTVGVWAAYDPSLSLVALDTEGLLGAAVNQNQRMRLLLKVILLVGFVGTSKIFNKICWGKCDLLSDRPIGFKPSLTGPIYFLNDPKLHYSVSIAWGPAQHCPKALWYSQCPQCRIWRPWSAPCCSILRYLKILCVQND